MNPRFSVERKEGTNHLRIADIHVSDSATYYCGSSHSNMVEFGEGIFLSVEGTVLVFSLALTSDVPLVFICLKVKVYILLSLNAHWTFCNTLLLDKLSC